MQHIRDFHIKRDYIVRVEKTEGRPGCMVDFPPNKLVQLPHLCKTYILFTDPCSIEIYSVIDGRESQTNVVQAANANVRLLIVQDVFLTAHRRGMSKELIMTQGDLTLFDMLKIPQTREEVEIETQLCVKFRALLAGEVVVSDIEGYDQVLSCFESGGL